MTPDPAEKLSPNNSSSFSNQKLSSNLTLRKNSPFKNGLAQTSQPANDLSPKFNPRSGASTSPVKPVPSVIGGQYSVATNDFDETNLIINYIPANMTQDELRLLFSQIGPVDNAKVVQDKITGQSLCYGFVKFKLAQDAKRAVDTFNGQFVGPKKLKVSIARPSSPQIKDANLYVSGFPRTFSLQDFCRLFLSYGEIITARILFDSLGRSRGVGFVRLDTHNNAERAISHLNGSKFPGFRERLNVKFANPNGSGPANMHNAVAAAYYGLVTSPSYVTALDWAMAAAMSSNRNLSQKCPNEAKKEVGEYGKSLGSEKDKETGSGSGSLSSANKKRPLNSDDSGVTGKTRTSGNKFRKMPICNVPSCINPNCIYGYPPKMSPNGILNSTTPILPNPIGNTPFAQPAVATGIGEPLPKDAGSMMCGVNSGSGIVGDPAGLGVVEGVVGASGIEGSGGGAGGMGNSQSVDCGSGLVPHQQVAAISHLQQIQYLSYAIQQQQNPLGFQQLLNYGCTTAALPFPQQAMLHQLTGAEIPYPYKSMPTVLAAKLTDVAAVPTAAAPGQGQKVDAQQQLGQVQGQISDPDQVKGKLIDANLNTEVKKESADVKVHGSKNDELDSQVTPKTPVTPNSSTFFSGVSPNPFIFNLSGNKPDVPNIELNRQFSWLNETSPPILNQNLGQSVATRDGTGPANQTLPSQWPSFAFPNYIPNENPSLFTTGQASDLSKISIPTASVSPLQASVSPLTPHSPGFLGYSFPPLVAASTRSEITQTTQLASSGIEPSITYNNQHALQTAAIVPNAGVFDYMQPYSHQTSLISPPILPMNQFSPTNASVNSFFDSYMPAVQTAYCPPKPNGSLALPKEFFVLLRNIPLSLPDAELQKVFRPISSKLKSYNRNNTQCKLMFCSLEDAANCVNKLNGKKCYSNVLEASLLPIAPM